MNETDLLAHWPGWDRKTPRELIESEAWAMRVRWGDDEARLRLSDNRPRDIIGLEITFDDEKHFLGIGERAAFPDLAALWDRKNDIPGNLVLALVEKECGRLLQLLENAVRRQLKVTGLADPDGRDGTCGFEVVGTDGSVIAGFALDVSPLVLEAFGDISAIDTSHMSIRRMTRPATAEYAVFSLGAESSSIEPGDYLLAPELENPVAAGWRTDEAPDDGKFRLRSPLQVPIRFSSFAEGDMPPVPAPDALELYHGSKRVAAGRAARLGEQSAFAVEEVF